MVSVAYFDIETNYGKDWLNLSDFRTVHCIGVSLNGDRPQGFGPDRLKEAIEILREADVVIGHNILRFDLPVLKNVFGFVPKDSLDTLIGSRLVWPEIITQDLIRDDFPSKLAGSHSLKAWGHRLGVLKETSMRQGALTRSLKRCSNTAAMTLLLLAIFMTRLSKKHSPLTRSFWSIRSPK